MSDIALPVRKEEVIYERGRAWNIRDPDYKRIAEVYDESHADAIVAAINGAERMREALKFYADNDPDPMSSLAAHALQESTQCPTP